MHRLLLSLALTLAASSLNARDLPKVVTPALQPFVSDHTISGGIGLVVGKDGIKALEAVGMSDLATQSPMPADAMFWIASMTKPMTALAVMMLVEEGKLAIEDPVQKHLPEFKGQMLAVEKDADHAVLKKPTRPITIKDLLTHSSGLVGKSPLEAAALDTLTLREAVLTYALSPLQFEPGSKWSYCNPGINTLGRLVEVASGIEYSAFMQQRLFDPLGMKDTTFWPNAAQLTRMAKSYKPGPTPGTLEEITVTYLSPTLHDRKRMPMPAGGLFSCARDLARIYMMLLNQGELDGHRYVKADTLQRMTTSQLGDMKVSFADGMHMGLGFHLVNQPQGVTESLSPGSFGHGGAYGTQAWIDPVRGLGIVLLIQRAGLPNSDQSEMRRALQKAAVEGFGR
jgi:CubicO group peptidase (beta-lactamase class C family)